VAVLQIAERYALAVLLLAVVLFFSFWPKTSLAYSQPDNYRNILSSQVILAVIALGSIVPLVCGQFDLSVGSVAGMTSVFTAASYADWGLPLWAGALVGIGIGALVGLVNGLVVTRFGVNAFITTLGSASVVTGIVTWYTGGNSIIQGIPTGLTSFGSGNWLGVPKNLYLLVVAALLIWYLLEHTPFGRYLHSVGQRRVGPPGRVEHPEPGAARFVVSGAAAGLAGVLLLAQSGPANPNAGVGSQLTLTALAAAFLGPRRCGRAASTCSGTLLAIYFLAAAITGLTYAGVKDYIHDLFTGAALVLAVAVSTILGRRRGA
jgi:ribose transport system permease protein